MKCFKIRIITKSVTGQGSYWSSSLIGGVTYSGDEFQVCQIYNNPEGWTVNCGKSPSLEHDRRGMRTAINAINTMQWHLCLKHNMMRELHAKQIQTSFPTLKMFRPRVFCLIKSFTPKCKTSSPQLATPGHITMSPTFPTTTRWLVSKSVSMIKYNDFDVYHDDWDHGR